MMSLSLTIQTCPLLRDNIMKICEYLLHSLYDLTLFVKPFIKGSFKLREFEHVVVFTGPSDRVTTFRRYLEKEIIYKYNINTTSSDLYCNKCRSNLFLLYICLI